MKKEMSIEQLKHKPVAMMTGEELAFLIESLAPQQATTPLPTTSVKKLYYGIAGIAELFGCSVPTANRIKKSGIIDKAITQVGRKIVLDGELALSLAKEAGGFRFKD